MARLNDTIVNGSMSVTNELLVNGNTVVTNVEKSGSGNVITNLTKDGDKLVATLGNETTLSKGTDVTNSTATQLSHGGEFTVMTDIGVSNHTITDTNTKFKLPTETSISVDISGPSTTATDLLHGGEFTVVTAVTKGDSSHNIDVAKTKFKLPNLAELAGAIIYKGTIGSSADGATVTTLPASPENGWCYKVITNGTYGGHSCKVGDLLIYNGSTRTWDLVPSGDDAEQFKGTVTRIEIGEGLAPTGGVITTSGTISHADTSSQASISASERRYITGVTLDRFGHVTALTTGTETFTNSAHTHDAGVGLGFVDDQRGGTSGIVKYKAKLRSETPLTIASAAATQTSGRVYPVVPDKDGYLAVNVPWTNVNSNYVTIPDFTDELAKKQDKIIKYTGVTSVSPTSFTSSTQYEDYPYEYSITNSNITANSIVDVYFTGETIQTGIMAPFCKSNAGSVTIYASELPESAVGISVITILN